MLKKSILLLLSFIVLLSLSRFPDERASAQAAEATGQWLSWRNDNGNTGFQPDPGILTQATDSNKVFIKGAVDRAPVFADVNGDGNNDIVMVDAGRVAAVGMDGKDIWLSDV